MVRNADRYIETMLTNGALATPCILHYMMCSSPKIQAGIVLFLEYNSWNVGYVTLETFCIPINISIFLIVLFAYVEL